MEESRSEVWEVAVRELGTESGEWSCGPSMERLNPMVSKAAHEGGKVKCSLTGLHTQEVTGDWQGQFAMCVGG